jgi:tungstate transport system ATP-binding protein
MSQEGAPGTDPNSRNAAAIEWNTPNPEDLYSIHSLEKSYGDRFSLRIEHLSIEKGEILALIGPSGAGKSTLLRLLNFLEEPDRGSIRFLGSEIQPGEDVPLPLRRRVTTVFQRPILLNRSVWANVSYGLRLRGERDADKQIWESLRTVGLTELAHQPARKLSGGEAQRVALARAILLNPDALLLDEPTANLDPYNVGLIESAIREMNLTKSTTVVLVTHNTFQARRLAHRAALLIDGTLVQIGEMEAYFETPNHPMVEAFMKGKMVY